MSRPKLNALELLEPRSADDRAALYRLIRDALGAEVVGSYEVVRQLALVGTRHLSGEGGRVFIRGAAGTGKTTLVRTLARVLDIPYMQVDTRSLAETNWAGTDLPAYLEILYEELQRDYPPALVPHLAARALVFIDDADSLRLPERYSSSTTRDYQTGRQQSLVPLVGNGVIPIKRGRGAERSWSSKQALVVVAGRFDGIDADVTDAGSLTSWGLVPALADKLAACSHVQLQELEFADVRRMLRREAERLVVSFRAFGVDLVVSGEVLAFMVNAWRSGQYEGGIAVAKGWLRTAAERVLVEVLESKATVGARVVLAPDDVRLPGDWSAFWR